MNCQKVIKIFLNNIGSDDYCLFTTGFISRYAFAVKDRPENFYMLGSMGLLSSVGLGLAMNTKKRVFIFEGDGSALMDMGTLAMIAYQSPKNIYHIVLDNEVYESTGAQPTISKQIDLAKIARSCGYRELLKVRNIDSATVKNLLRKRGPTFVLIKIDPKESPAPRVKLSPEKLKERIRNNATER